MNQLQLTFLGTFQVSVDGRNVLNWRSVKIQGLLAYLALTPQRAHTRERLAAMFWPDEPDEVARKNLRQALYRLRRLLNDQAPSLQSTRSTVQFNLTKHVLLDVSIFLDALEEMDLAAAVSHYAGDLLPGFSCDSLPFDDWLRQERERLHRLALAALNEETAHQLTRADYEEAERLARQQLALEPWREEAHRQLIQILYLMGERSAALAQVDVCKQVLAEELGVGLSDETQRLVAHIHTTQSVPARRHRTASSDERRLAIPFVGRNAEIETLVNAYQRTSNNGFQAVTIQGQAGMGKTRLTEQFIRWAATQGADVVNGRSFETSAGLSYQPLTHLLRQRLERENAPEDLLSDLWLAQLTRLLPEIRDRYPDLPAPIQEENTARQHLLEAITRLLQALARRGPLVLVIDDWHWADTASMDALHYAATRLAEEKTPILLLLTLRQEAVDERLTMQSWLSRLRRDVVTTQLTLSAFSPAETEQFLQKLLSSDGEPPSTLSQFNKWLFTETGGQPLFLTETMKALAEEGLITPTATASAWQIDWAAFDEEAVKSRILQGVQDLIKGWLARVSDPARALLTAVSILAQAATFDHLYRVAGLKEMQALDALDELLNKQLLLETSPSLLSITDDPIFSFYHQKVSEVVYAETSSARRRILHRRALEALQAEKASAADCAYHALHAGLPTETIRYSLDAAHEAIALFAFNVAIVHFERAWKVTEQKGWPESLSGADKQALYAGLGRAYELTEAWPKARTIYEAMIAEAQAIGAEAMACLGLNRLATIYLDGGIYDPDQVAEHLERARTIAEQRDDKRGLAETEWNLSRAAFYERDFKSGLDHGERALAIARELGHPQLLARCLSGLAYVYALQWQLETVLAHAAEAQRYYAEAGNLILAADCQRLVGITQIEIGQSRQALITLEEMLTFSQQIENLWGEADSTFKLAYAHAELGHYDQAILLAKRGVEQAHIVAHPPMLMMAQLFQGVVKRAVMDLDTAREHQLDVKLKTSEGFFPFPDWPLAELCAIHALAGEWEQAYDYAKQIVQYHNGGSLQPKSLTSWFETEALLRGGDGELARAEVARVASLVGNNRRYQLPLLRSQAVLAQWDGDAAEAIAHLEAALMLAQEMELPGEVWPILGELGKLYAKQGKEVKSKDAFREAAVLIRRLAETIDDVGLREGFVTAVSPHLLRR